jgi:acetamidase/formamidase
MQRIMRDQARKYAFDWEDEPLLRVQCGESFEIETYDAATGYFKSEQDKAIPVRRPGFDKHPPLANPIGGPVWLEGAAPGDTLVITIEDILVADTSWIAIGPRRGPLGESTRWPELSGDYTTKIFRHTPGPSGTTRDGTLHFNERLSWPITPFIGTIGVAPQREVTTSLDGQGEWGGNLDIRDVAPGNPSCSPFFIPVRSSTWATSTPARVTPNSPAPPLRRRPPCACGWICSRASAFPGCGSTSPRRSSPSTPTGPWKEPWKPPPSI